MGKNLLVCQSAFILGITFFGIVSARQRTLHICDAPDASSEECSKFRPRSLTANSEFEVKFTLYNYRGEYVTFTRETFDTARAVTAYTKNAQWKILVPGFLQNRETLFPQNVKTAYLQHMAENKDVRYNVLVFDWGKGACAELTMISAYLEAVKNVPKAAEILAQMIVDLKSRNMLDISKVHVIGYSLGAHVAGAVGQSLIDLGQNKIGRVSGLDPAGPRFWNMNRIPTPSAGLSGNYSLNANQAKFVDVYHTSMSFGTMDELGDADIYVNGGLDQPSCDIDAKVPIFGTYKLWVFRSLLQICSHNYATDLFAKSINDNSMVACFRCKSYQAFKDNDCECDNLILGEHLVQSSLTIEPKGRAYANVPKDTSVGSNYIQLWKNTSWKDWISGTWNTICSLL